MDASTNADTHGTGGAPALPPAWADAVRRIADGEARRIMILGATDVGKSSLALALLDAIGAQEALPLLLDADPGQKMAGPPGTASLAAWKDRRLDLRRIAFVGSTSAAEIDALCRAVRRLAAAPLEGRLVINTSGLVRGPGVRLKLAKIAAAEPDLLLAIEPETLSPILQRTSVPALHLRRSPYARRKSPAARARARRAAFARHMTEASSMRLAAGDAPDMPEVRAWPTEPAARPVCALVDAAGEDMALGVLLAATADGVTLSAPPVPRRLAAIRLGSMWARPDAEGWELLDELLPAGGDAGDRSALPLSLP